MKDKKDFLEGHKGGNHSGIMIDNTQRYGLYGSSSSRTHCPYDGRSNYRLVYHQGRGSFDRITTRFVRGSFKSSRASSSHCSMDGIYLCRSFWMMMIEFIGGLCPSLVLVTCSKCC